MVLIFLRSFGSRLHKEALMQAAVDPSTGKIDISILTTGISGAVRKQRAERANMLRGIIRSKGRVLTLKYQKVYDEMKDKIMEKGELVSSILQLNLDRILLVNLITHTKEKNIFTILNCQKVHLLFDY